MNFDITAVFSALPLLVDATKTTLSLVFLACIFGLILGVILGLMRLIKNPVVQLFSGSYVFFFRGTPLLIQIFLIYYGLAQFAAVQNSIFWPILEKPFWCAIIAFSLNSAAYIAEIVRGAILSIPKGEIEAADAIGLGELDKYRHIILPRAFGIMWPAYSNEVIFVIKGSALASTITIMELTLKTRDLMAKNYLILEMFAASAIIYMSISWLFMLFAKGLERLINRHRYAKR